MRIGRAAARVAVLVGVVFLALQFLAQPVGATSYTLSGSADCTALGGVWSLGCTFSSLTIASGDSLTIEPFVVVDVTASLTVDGGLDNEGGLLLDASTTTTVSGYFHNGNLLENYGTLTINPGGSFFNDGFSPGFTNYAGANLNVLGYGENNASGTILSYGSMAIGPGGEFDNYGDFGFSGSLTTYGFFYNAGGVVDDGYLNDATGGYVETAGTLDNYDTVNVTSELDNYGTFTTYSSSVVNIGNGEGFGYLENDGSIVNLGTYAVSVVRGARQLRGPRQHRGHCRQHWLCDQRVRCDRRERRGCQSQSRGVHPLRSGHHLWLLHGRRCRDLWRYRESLLGGWESAAHRPIGWRGASVPGQHPDHRRRRRLVDHDPPARRRPARRLCHRDGCSILRLSGLRSGLL